MFKKIIFTLFVLFCLFTNTHAAWYKQRPSNLDSVNSPQEGYILTYDSETKKYRWKFFGVDTLGTFSTPNTTGGDVTWDTLNFEVFVNTSTAYKLPLASEYRTKTVCFYNTSGTNNINIDPQDSDVIVREGEEQLAGVTIVLSSGAGNYVYLFSDGEKWITRGKKGMITEGI